MEKINRKSKQLQRQFIQKKFYFLIKRKIENWQIYGTAYYSMV